MPFIYLAQKVNKVLLVKLDRRDCKVLKGIREIKVPKGCRVR